MSEQIIVYGTRWCPDCTRAKQVLTNIKPPSPESILSRTRQRRITWSRSTGATAASPPSFSRTAQSWWSQAIPNWRRSWPLNPALNIFDRYTFQITVFDCDSGKPDCIDFTHIGCHPIRWHPMWRNNPGGARQFRTGEEAGRSTGA